MKKSILSVVLALAVVSAQAAGSSTGTITVLLPAGSGVSLFTSSGASTGQPACATQAGRFAVDTNTQAGRTQDAHLRWAAALGKTVTFIGLGTCSLQGDSETLNYVSIPN